MGKSLLSCFLSHSVVILHRLHNLQNVDLLKVVICGIHYSCVEKAIKYQSAEQS